MMQPVLAITGLSGIGNGLGNIWHRMPLPYAATCQEPANELLATVTSASDTVAEVKDGAYFVAAPAGEAIAQLAAAFPELVFLVLYRSPWRAFDEIISGHPQTFAPRTADALALWQAYYRQVLRARIQWGERILLVNADHLHRDNAPLHALLSERFGIQLPITQLSSPAPSTVDLARAVGRSHALGLIAPEYCETYEALESCALLFGREPEFRQLLPEADSAFLEAIADEWYEPHAIKQLRQSVQVLEVARDQLAAQCITQKADMELALEVERAELDRVRQDLGKERDHCSALEMALNAERADVRRVLNLMQEAREIHDAESRQLTQELRGLREQCINLQADLAAEMLACDEMRDEGLAFLTQLAGERQCHEAAMKTLSNVADQQLAEAQATHVEVTQELQRVREQYALLDLQLANERIALKNSQEYIRELQADLDDVMLQLHEDQANLEHYYLESQEMRQTLSHSSSTMDRAHRLISRLITADISK